MKNILLVLVGGTICTELGSDGMLSVNRKAGIKLKERYLNSDSFCADKINIECTENLLVLSENMTVSNWNLIIDTLRKHTSKKRFDGIIIAHGTDTLAFSAALFSLILSSLQTPVFFVSSNKHIDNNLSNGVDNFKSAVECIYSGISPNVYAVYRNLNDNRMYLHLASRLVQCANYLEDFYSIGAIDITNLTKDNCDCYFKEIGEKYPQNNKNWVIDLYGNWHLTASILKIEPYVGIDYSAFDYSSFSAVLHGTYHSGTACSEKSRYCDIYSKNSILYMLDKCSSYEKPIDTYLAPAKQTGEVYETVGIIANHLINGRKIELLYGMTNEMAYAKLVLAYSISKEKAEIIDILKTQFNFEYID